MSGVTEWGALSRKSEQPAHEHHKQGRRVWACDYHLRRARWRGGPWPSSSSVLDPAEDTLTLSFITEATRVDSAGNFMTREHLEMLVRTCNGRTSPAAAAASTSSRACPSTHRHTSRKKRNCVFGLLGLGVSVSSRVLGLLHAEQRADVGIEPTLETTKND